VAWEIKSVRHCDKGAAKGGQTVGPVSTPRLIKLLIISGIRRRGGGLGILHYLFADARFGVPS